MSHIINTESFSKKLRKIAVDKDAEKLLVTNLKDTDQEKDLTEPVNCKGFGRIRHFRYSTSKGWPKNSLPIEPACKALSITPDKMLTAQVFQNSVCNWRCWYCYVPFSLLSGDRKHSHLLSASDLIDLYTDESNPPKVIDLSGGQPDLVPEWVPWMMRELKKRNLDDKVYLWSDDNLSNDYFWKYLSQNDINLISSYKNYGKVCCFKGFDSKSFSFNTQAHPDLFKKQFSLISKFLDLGIDLYGYVTLTTPSNDSIDKKISQFVDELQKVHENLPLRIIPLEVNVYSPVESRLNETKESSLQYQQIAINEWNNQLEKRFTSSQISSNIVDIPLRGT